MWLSDVTILSSQAIAKSTVLKVAVGSEVSRKKEFEAGTSLFLYQLQPTVKLISGINISVKLTQRNTLRNKTLISGSFADPTSTVEYEENGLKISLNIVDSEEPLQDLINSSKEFTEELKSVLDRLGRGKQILNTGLSLAAIAAEFHPAAKAILGFVDAAHKHLEDQEKSDSDVKELAERLPLIFSQLQDVQGSTGSAARLINLLSKGEKLSRECVEFIINYCSTPVAARTFRAVINSSVKEKLEELTSRFSVFRDEFDRELLVQVHLKISSALAPATASTLVLAPNLPPKPVRLFGRELEVGEVVSALMCPSPLVAILGEGGIGKTTLTLWSMHDESVRGRFKSRIFAACDSATSLSLLLNTLADALGIPPSSRDMQLYQTVLQSMAQTTRLLCLDNFETPWEGTHERDQIEDLLRHLHAIPALGLIITMRGTEHPASELPWSLTPSALSPLSFKDSISMFEDISGKTSDENAEKLIEAVACIPLALKLVAALARDQDIGALLRRWDARGTAIVKSSGAGRKYNLDTSISLSVESPRMIANPDAKLVLALIAVLPDGLSDAMCSTLEEHMPEVDISDALMTLKHVALVYAEAGGVSRHRLLPPIRRWCKSNLVLPPEMNNALFLSYINLFCTHRKRTPDAIKIVTPELVNGEEVLLGAYQVQHQHDGAAKAAVIHSQWCVWRGYISSKVISAAVDAESGVSKADCLQQLSRVLRYRYEYDEAETAIQSAREEYRKAQSTLGEGNSLNMLGYLFMLREKFDKAEAVLQSARALHRDARSVSDEAGDLRLLGSLYMRRGQLDQAELTLISARGLHQQAQKVGEEANDLNTLGRIHVRQGKYDEAETAFQSARELHKKVHDTRGEANDVQGLGTLYTSMDRLDEAEEALESALAFHRQLESTLGKANDLRFLGDLHMRRDRLDTAEKFLKSALDGHRQARNDAGEWMDLKRLGRLYMRQGSFEEAEAVLQLALEVHQRTGVAQKDEVDPIPLDELVKEARRRRTEL